MMSAEEQRQVVKQFLDDQETVVKKTWGALDIKTLLISPLLYACLRTGDEIAFADGEAYCAGYKIKVTSDWGGIQYSYEMIPPNKEETAGEQG